MAGATTPLYEPYCRGLAVCNLLAFLSYSVQWRGLIGSQGIKPIRPFLEWARLRTGTQPSSTTGQQQQPFASHVKQLVHLYHRLPTLLWINSTDTAIGTIIHTGIACSLLMFWGSGLLRTLAVAGCFISYLSLTTVSEPWLSLQMDANLIEVDFVFLLCSPFSRTYPTVLLWAVRWFTFRVMLACGLVKWYGSRNWRDLTAMQYHYWTQPIPNPVSMYAHQVPGSIHKAEVLITFLVEGPLCFLVFLGSTARMIAGLGFCVLNIGINLTGNYGFLGVLTVVESLSLLDDNSLRMISRLFKPAVAVSIQPIESSAPTWLKALAWACVAPYLVISYVPLAHSSKGLMPVPRALEKAADALRRYRICNHYGKFGSMTTFRWELVVEGTQDKLPNDMCKWHEYEFRFKPSNINHMPPIIPGHLPRLDWRLWFLPHPLRLGVDTMPGWMADFMQRLLEARPEVLGLLRTDPFNGQKPSKVRIRVYEYTFPRLRAKHQYDEFLPGVTDKAEDVAPGTDMAPAGAGSTAYELKMQYGKWWNRKLIGQWGNVFRQRRHSG